MDSKGLTDQAKLETIHVLLSRLTEYYIQLVKAVLVLNAGAIVAILGFMQALASKSPPTILYTLKPYGLWAAALYLLGLVLGAGGLWYHYKELSHGLDYLTDSPPPRKSRKLGTQLLKWWQELWELGPVLGGIAFVTASIVLLRGMAVSI